MTYYMAFNDKHIQHIEDLPDRFRFCTILLCIMDTNSNFGVYIGDIHSKFLSQLFSGPNFPETAKTMKC